MKITRILKILIILLMIVSSLLLSSCKDKEEANTPEQESLDDYMDSTQNNINNNQQDESTEDLPLETVDVEVMSVNGDGTIDVRIIDTQDTELIFGSMAVISYKDDIQNGNKIKIEFKGETPLDDQGKLTFRNIVSTTLIEAIADRQEIEEESSENQEQQDTEINNTDE